MSYHDGIHLVPEHMRGTTARWIDEGIDGGSFLMALVHNDFCGAISRADSVNLEALHDWAVFFYNFTPSDCWGAREKAQKWAEARRLERETA